MQFFRELTASVKACEIDLQNARDDRKTRVEELSEQELIIARLEEETQGLRDELKSLKVTLNTLRTDFVEVVEERSRELAEESIFLS